MKSEDKEIKTGDGESEGKQPPESFVHKAEGEVKQEEQKAKEDVITED